MDTARIIDADTRVDLERTLTTLSEQTGVQIAVLTVPNLDGISIEAYSMKVAEQWQLGTRGRDNGVLLTVAVQEHELRIETGYGVEGTLTDAKCGIIIREYITPHFKRGDYSAGIKSGVQAITGLLVGDEETIAQFTAREQATAEEAEEPLGLTLFALFVTVIIMLALFSRKDERRVLLHGAKYGNLGGGRGASRDRSRGSGGGFHGGGGKFGGGGASGKW